MAMTKSFQSLLAFILVITIIIGINPTNTVLSQPIIKDTNLKAEIFAQGLKSPTSMAFLGPKDILVIEKEDGTVKRIVNGTCCHNHYFKFLLQQKVKGVCWE